MATAQKLALYGKYTSSACWRVRCALNIKNLEYETRPVNLQDLSDENGRTLLKLNPASRVPVLLHGERVLTESLAIIEYLEENFGGPTLLPGDAYDKARSRAIALHIACGVHPLQNLRVTRKVHELFGLGESRAWSKYWMHLGLKELEGMVVKTAGDYAVGNNVSIADTCIPSIVYKGRALEIDVTEFPTLLRVEKNLEQLKPFLAALPSEQPDAPKE